MNLVDRIVGGAVAATFAALRRTDPDRASDLCGALARRIGPSLPQSRIGRANLRAAYPDVDEAWIEETLRGVWGNLGRTAGEYVHLGELWDYDRANPNAGRIVTSDEPLFDLLLNDGKPALCFAAHLGNWELGAVMAARHGMPSAVVYRMPNNRAVAAQIEKIRGSLMGRLINARVESVFEMAGALERGEHLGMLVDQHFSRGVDVTFFGRTCKANPTIGRLARRYNCPVVGLRVIREPDHHFRVTGTGPLDLPRDKEGLIDVQGAMQAITSVVEGWIREHPDQWLWLHRRWR